MGEEHVLETQQMQGQFTEAQAQMQEVRRSLEEQIHELEQRWLNRESRPEDLERIRQLEEEMVEKDALVKKTKEEMIWFKRELMNREENFNQKFNRQPNVGVMQVV